MSFLWVMVWGWRVFDILFGFGVAALLSYVVYYFTKLVSTVRLSFINNERNNQIVQSCSLLRGKYWPSPWVFNSHLQGVILMKLRVKKNPLYRREILQADDGASLELDWGESAGPTLSNESPIILLFSGVTGNSSSSYLVYLSIAFRSKGYRPVIMNYPNATGSPLTSPRFFCLDSVSDTREFVEHVHSLYPNAPKIAVGFSLGGHFFLKYAQEVQDNKLSGLMTLSAPFSSSKCVSAWKGQWVHENVYDKHFLGKFKGGFERNRELFKTLKELDHKKILQATNMDELHTSLSIPLHKVTTMEEYHELMSSDKKMDQVKVPTLILHAWNDPVVPPYAIPFEAIKKNPFIIFAATQTGGHTGWLSGLMPWKNLAWCEQLALQFASAILDVNAKQK